MPNDPQSVPLTLTEGTPARNTNRLWVTRWRERLFVVRAATSYNAAREIIARFGDIMDPAAAYHELLDTLIVYDPAGPEAVLGDHAL